MPDKDKVTELINTIKESVKSVKEKTGDDKVIVVYSKSMYDKIGLENIKRIEKEMGCVFTVEIWDEINRIYKQRNKGESIDSTFILFISKCNISDGCYKDIVNESKLRHLNGEVYRESSRHREVVRYKEVARCKEVTRYEDSCERVALTFMEKYFMEGGGMPEYYFVANDVTGVLSVNDFFFSIDAMYKYMKYGYTDKDMIRHYYYALDGGNVNIENFLYLNGEGKCFNDVIQT